MATTSNASPNNNNPSGHNNVCVDREQLLRYLQGWTDEATAQQLESHLSHCPDCDQSLSELESEVKIGWPEVAGPFGFSRFPQGTGAEDDAGVDDGFSGGRSLPAVRSQAEPGNENTPPGNEPGNEPRNEPRNEPGNEHGNEPGNERNQDNRPLESGLLNSELGNYQLLELIGRGGMAEVYKARHKRLQKEVALKLIRVPRWYLADSLGRIDREMQAVGRLNHPSIVRAMDAGEQNGIQYLATEYIDGLDLGRIARLIGKFPIAEACELIRTAALGLDYAHGEGIIHRDIKPSNLMLDRNGQVRILDFGLVHLDGWTGASAELTTVGQLLGTLDYMAPEQAERPDNVSHRSDVYSLGATLFRMLVGRAPYAASQQQSPLEKLRLLASERPPRVGTLAPELPEPLARLIDRCLDRDPNLRPSSAAHLAEELIPFCQQADLPRLLKRAEQSSLATHSTESSHSADSPSGFAPSLSSLISHSLASESGLVQPEIQATPSAAAAAAIDGRGGKSNSRRRWLAWGMFPLFILAGILLILETQKGQVIIESEVPNLHVELVADGKVYRELEIVPGENSTRIYAGQYEVRISDGTDRYVVDQNKFVLKRRGRVVARVTLDPEPGKARLAWSDRNSTDANTQIANKATAANAQPNTDQETQSDLQIETTEPRLIPGFPLTPVYDGKSLGEWLWVLENEIIADRLREAKNAIAHFHKTPHLGDLLGTYIVEHLVSSRDSEWMHTFVPQLHNDPRLRPVMDDFIMDKIASGDEWGWIENLVGSASFPTAEQKDQILTWCIEASGKRKWRLLYAYKSNFRYTDFEQWLTRIFDVVDGSSPNSWHFEDDGQPYNISTLLTFALAPSYLSSNYRQGHLEITNRIRELQQKLLNLMLDKKVISAVGLLNQLDDESNELSKRVISDSPWAIREIVSRILDDPENLVEPKLKLAWWLFKVIDNVDSNEYQDMISSALEKTLEKPEALLNAGLANLHPLSRRDLRSFLPVDLELDRLKVTTLNEEPQVPSIPVHDLIVILQRLGELENHRHAILDQIYHSISHADTQFRLELQGHFGADVVNDSTKQITILLLPNTNRVMVRVYETTKRKWMIRQLGIPDLSESASSTIDSTSESVGIDRSLAVAYIIRQRIDSILFPKTVTKPEFDSTTDFVVPDALILEKAEDDVSDAKLSQSDDANRAAADSTGQPSSGTGTAGSTGTVEELAIGDGSGAKPDQPRSIPGFPATPVYDEKSLGEWLWISENDVGPISVKAPDALYEFYQNQRLRPLLEEFIMQRLAVGTPPRWIHNQALMTAFPTPEQAEQIHQWCVEATGDRKHAMFQIWCFNREKFDNFEKFLVDALEIFSRADANDWISNEKVYGELLFSLVSIGSHTPPKVDWKLRERTLSLKQKLVNIALDKEAVLPVELFQSSLCIPGSPPIYDYFSNSFLNFEQVPAWLYQDFAKRAILTPEWLTSIDLKLAWHMLRDLENADKNEYQSTILQALENGLANPKLLTSAGITPAFPFTFEDSKWYYPFTIDKPTLHFHNVIRDPKGHHIISIPIHDLLVVLQKCGDLQSEQLAILDRVRAAILDDSLSFRNQLTGHFGADVLDDMTKSISILFDPDSANVSVSVSEYQSPGGGRRRSSGGGLPSAGVSGAGGRMPSAGLGGAADLQAGESITLKPCQVKPELAVAYLIDLKIQELLNSTDAAAPAATPTDSDD